MSFCKEFGFSGFIYFIVFSPACCAGIRGGVCGLFGWFSRVRVLHSFWFRLTASLLFVFCMTGWR